MKWKWEFYKFWFEKSKKFDGRLLCHPPKNLGGGGCGVPQM